MGAPIRWIVMLGPCIFPLGACRNSIPRRCVLSSTRSNPEYASQDFGAVEPDQIISVSNRLRAAGDRLRSVAILSHFADFRRASPLAERPAADWGQSLSTFPIASILSPPQEACHRNKRVVESQRSLRVLRTEQPCRAYSSEIPRIPARRRSCLSALSVRMSPLRTA